MEPVHAADARLWQEIAEQPAVLSAAARRTAAVAELGRRLWASPRPLAVLAARGTSDNAAIYAKYLIEVFLGTPVALAAPSVYTLYGGRVRLDGAVLVALSQSGASPDLVRVVEEGRRAGAVTVAVVNRVDSALAAAAEHVVDVGAGAEESVAATKSFTAQLLTLAQFILGAAGGSEAAAAMAALDRVGPAAAQALTLAPSVEDWAVRAASGWRSAYVVGRGFAFPVALEIALKMKEMASVLADGYSAADVRHGPIALRGEDLPFVVIGGSGRARDDLLSLVRQAHDGASPTVALTDDDEVADAADTAFRLAHLPEALAPIPAAVLGQVVAYALARARGTHPGEPEGIHKVTRTL